MEYLVVAYRSRAHTVKFADALNRFGVRCEIVNTPKEAGVGCGLSVKTKKENYLAVKNAVFSLALNSFAGIFLVTVISGKRFVKSI